MGSSDSLTDEERKSEAPDDAGGCAIVVLVGAGIAGMHVISLEAPGEIFERKFVVQTAADVDEEGIVDKAAGIQVAHTDHGIDEGTEFSDVSGETGAADEVVLSYAGSAIKTAGVNDKTDVRKAWEGKGFERAIPAAIALPVDDIRELSIGNTSVNVSVGKEPIKLC